MSTFCNVYARLTAAQTKQLQLGFSYIIAPAATGGTWTFTDTEGVTSDIFDIPFNTPAGRGPLGALSTTPTQLPVVTCLTGNITIFQVSL